MVDIFTKTKDKEGLEEEREEKKKSLSIFPYEIGVLSAESRNHNK